MLIWTVLLMLHRAAAGNLEFAAEHSAGCWWTGEPLVCAGLQLWLMIGRSGSPIEVPIGRPL